MKCYFHEIADAVASCLHCGKALCKECASLYSPCACPECYARSRVDTALQQEEAKKSALISTNFDFLIAILKGTVSAVVATFIISKLVNEPISIDFLGVAVMFFFLPFGWAVITNFERWLPVFFLSGWFFLIYLMCKICFSIFLGIPCFLFQVIRYIVRLVRALKA